LHKSVCGRAVPGSGRALRQALDAAAAHPQDYRVAEAWSGALGKVSEGSQSTLGAYSRPWK